MPVLSLKIGSRCEVRSFESTFPLFDKVNYRNHRKIVVIDGLVGFRRYRSGRTLYAGFSWESGVIHILTLRKSRTRFTGSAFA